jgi:6-phosphogluconolactonase
MIMLRTPLGATLEVADAAATFASAADRFLTAGARAQAEGRDFLVALAGGETPRALYALLSDEAHASRLDWARVVWCWGDERCVPPRDAASNYRMAHEALLTRVPVSSARVLRVETEYPPAEAARRYERTLRGLFSTPEGAPPREPGRCFDLVLLGLGADGHTASLFPHSPALSERDAWALATPAPTPGPARVTLSARLIAAAHEVLLLVSGTSKRQALHATLFGADDPLRWPLQAIGEQARRLHVLADTEAAGQG